MGLFDRLRRREGVDGVAAVVRRSDPIGHQVGAQREQHAATGS